MDTIQTNNTSISPCLAATGYKKHSDIGYLILTFQPRIILPMIRPALHRLSGKQMIYPDSDEVRP